MTNQGKAFTVVELLLIVLFLGIFAAIAVPRLQFATLHGKQADTVARKIVTDLRRTRTLAISYAANNTAGFRLQMVGSPPYSGYQIVDANSGSVVDSQTIDSQISCDGSNQFNFGPLGNLTGSSGQLTVAAGGKTFIVTVISATGAVICQEN